MSKPLLVFAFISIYCLSEITSAYGNQCYTCRGINCLRTTSQKDIEICENNLDSCVTIFDKFAVVAKGCLMNIPVELRKKCSDANNPECQTCVGTLCNNKGRKDFKCYECDERNNDNSKCATTISEFSPVQCSIPTAPNSYCFLKKYTGFTIRGCSVSVKDQLACLADGACSLCLAEDGEGCNSKEMAAAGVNRMSSEFALMILCASIMRAIF